VSGPPKDPGKPGKIWQRVRPNQASVGYDLVANIILGFGLGWGAQWLWPGIKPWGYFFGVLLGAVSGFYQLFKLQNRDDSQKKAG